MSAIAPEEVSPQLFERTGIREDFLDEDACKVVARLRRKGHESFLVGGCVRDLLLRRTPKDFDVATSARPRQVKSLFRNCRIIGRRFKLAHLHFDRKILEVSTFRRRPEAQNDEDDEDLLIRSDNAFGTANEDAHRRDFTINALFFDPETDCIHDYVGGIEDIERGVVRTIGDPLTRIKEDPVRILRAVKFASRLGLRIDEDTWNSMVEAAEDLSRSAPPRLLEEITRLLRSGSSVRAFQLLRDCGALRVLMPELATWLEDRDASKRLAFWRGLEAVDSRVRKDAESIGAPVLFAMMLWPLFDEREESNDKKLRDVDLGRLVESVLGPILKNLSFSRLESGRLKRILVVQRRFNASDEAKTDDGKPARTRGFRPAAFVKQDYFLDALQLFELRCIARDDEWSELDEWSRYYAEITGEREPVERASLTSNKDKQRPPKRTQRDTREDEDGERRGRRRGGSRRERRSKRDARNGRGEERRGKKKRRGRRERVEVEAEPATPLPPLPDVELDPAEIPTYGSVLGDKGSAEKIELERSKGKRARKRMKAEEEPYVPPPPPEDTGGSRGDDDDTFGDW